jgi:hypothetical protein
MPFALAMAGCAGSSAGHLVPSNGINAASPAIASNVAAPVHTGAAFAPVAVPASLAFLASGIASAQTLVVREPGNASNYTLNKACDGIVRFHEIQHLQGAVRYSVTPLVAGSCTVRFVDARKRGVRIPISVTQTFAWLGSSSVGPHAKSVAVVLHAITIVGPDVSSATITEIPACLRGCSIGVPPSRPGPNAYAVTVYDGAGGTGHVLATGTTVATVVAAQKNLVRVVPPRVPGKLTLGTAPSGSAAVPFAPVSLPLVIADADGDVIPGTFASPVTVTDDDSSAIAQGSYLTLDGGAPARSVALTKSTDTIALGYGGLAIAPAHITATASAAVLAQTAFSPAVPAVAYAGPLNGWHQPEIDLYDPTPGQPGYASSFALSQSGWSASPFVKPFIVTGSGTNNDCSSFTIVQTPSQPPSFSVTLIAAPVPGACTLTLTGASAASSTTLLLTYTKPAPIHVH